MADIIKVNMTDIWSVEGDRVPPESEKIKVGWGVELVPRQWLNWISYRQDNNLAYLFQKGIPEWDNSVEYLANKSYVQHDGTVYKAIIGGAGRNPITNPTYWIKAFGNGDDSLSDYLRAIRDTPLLPNTFQYIDNGRLTKTSPVTDIGRNILGSANANEIRAILEIGSIASDIEEAKQAALDARQSAIAAEGSENDADASATAASASVTAAQTAVSQALAARDSSEAFAVDSLAAATQSQTSSIAASQSALEAKASENIVVDLAEEVRGTALAAVYSTSTSQAGEALRISNDYTVYHTTLTQGTTTIVMDSDVPVGQSRQYTLILNQGVGSRFVEFPDTIRWADNRKPVLSFDPNAEDIISILHVGGLPYFFGFFNGGSFA